MKREISNQGGGGEGAKSEEEGVIRRGGRRVKSCSQRPKKTFTFIDLEIKKCFSQIRL